MYDKPDYTDIGGYGRGNASPKRSRESNGSAPSRVVGRRGGRRPATAGAMRSLLGTQGFSHEQQRYPDEQGYSVGGKELSPVGKYACEPRSERGVDTAPDIAYGMISSMSEQPLLKRSGHEPAFQHTLSDSVQAWDTSRGRQSGGVGPTSGKASCRVFNSTAAVWVYSVVIEPSNRDGNPNVSFVDINNSSVQRDSSTSENMKLTAVAQRAIEEVFDRYDIEGQGFLLSGGIASIQELSLIHI